MTSQARSEPADERGFDRLIAFSDAVVAIAITLLVLPLVEVPGEIADGANLGHVLSTAQDQLIAFAVSFLVIWRLWAGHHRIFGFYRAIDRTTSALNLAWLATIVVLPFPTALLSTPVAERGAVALYVGVLLISTLLLQSFAWRAHRHPELLDDSPAARAWLADRVGWALPASMVLALIVALVFPTVGPWVMLLLFGPAVLDAARTGFRHRRNLHRDDHPAV